MWYGYIYKVKTMLCSVVVMASVDYLDVDGSIPAVVTYFAHGHQTIYMISMICNLLNPVWSILASI